MNTTRTFLFPKLCRDQHGVTALEFTMIAPAVLLFMMGIIEFSMIMFVSGVMEAATSSTSRLGKTGYTAPGSSRQDQIIANIKNMTAGILNTDKLVITTKVYSRFSDIGKPEPFVDSNGNHAYNAGESYSDVNGNGQWDNDMAQAGLGNANDIVVYTATYPWPIATPIMNHIIGATYPISARMAVKNEPYNIQ
jgi:Flp pilus assembly protein TadG